VVRRDRQEVVVSLNAGAARLAATLGRISARFVPSSFAIAVLLTLLTVGAALVATEAGPVDVLRAWGDGLWGLLAFAMRMCVMVFSGYVLASAPPVTRALRSIASLPRSPRAAVAFVAVTSMLLGLLNWGLSIVAAALLVRHVAARDFAGRRADFPLLVACGYFGLGATWHAGLSASAPLIAATAGEPLTMKFGVVPIDETLLSPFNVALVVATVVLLTGLAALMHPDASHTRPLDGPPPAHAAPAAELDTGIAARLDRSRWPGLVLGGAGLVYAGMRAGTSGRGAVDIDFVNLVFLSLAVLLHGRPASIVRASEEAASVLGGIVLQFPLYAGIAAIIEKTGLAARLADLLVGVSSKGTYTALVYLYSGVVNYFVPSGGAKWAIEAEYILAGARHFDVPASSVVLAYAWGDMATDLIQPFWALPLLAVARLEFKDILGYLMLACAAYVAMVTTAFLIFR